MTTVLISRNLCKHYYCQRPKDDLLYWQNDAALTCDSMAYYTFRFSIPHIQSSYESSFFKGALPLLLLSHFSHVWLCDPIDGSPPGSPVPGILQARTLEWVAISFSNAWKWKSESEVTQSCPTLRDPMDCSLPGSSVHGIFQARVLEWAAIAFSERCSRSLLSVLLIQLSGLYSASLLPLPSTQPKHKRRRWVNFIGLVSVIHQ